LFVSLSFFLKNNFLRGGYLSECFEGHIGPLCGSCSLGYSKIGKNKCNKCLNDEMNIISVVGIMMIIFVLLQGFLMFF
jgi:hypothetical protein